MAATDGAVAVRREAPGASRDGAPEAGHPRVGESARVRSG